MRALLFSAALPQHRHAPVGDPTDFEFRIQVENGTPLHEFLLEKMRHMSESARTIDLHTLCHDYCSHGLDRKSVV